MKNKNSINEGQLLSDFKYKFIKWIMLKSKKRVNLHASLEHSL